MLDILLCFFFFNDPATTEIYTLPLHDALPISATWPSRRASATSCKSARPTRRRRRGSPPRRPRPRSLTRLRKAATRSEEHTSELQSRQYLVCRLLLEKKKKNHSISQ